MQFAVRRCLQNAGTGVAQRPSQDKLLSPSESRINQQLSPWSIGEPAGSGVPAVTSGAGVAPVDAPAVQHPRPAQAQQMAEGERESSSAEPQPVAEARPALAGALATDAAGGDAAAASSSAVPAGPQAVDAVGDCDSRQPDGAVMPDGAVDMPAGGEDRQRSGSPRRKGSEVTYRQVRQLSRVHCKSSCSCPTPAHSCLSKATASTLAAVLSDLMRSAVMQQQWRRSHCPESRVQYRGEEDLRHVMRLIDTELSEPYSIFTYRCTLIICTSVLVQSCTGVPNRGFLNSWSLLGVGTFCTSGPASACLPAMAAARQSAPSSPRCITADCRSDRFCIVVIRRRSC